jgi:hypothetical protein
VPTAVQPGNIDAAYDRYIGLNQLEIDASVVAAMSIGHLSW